MKNKGNLNTYFEKLAIENNIDTRVAIMRPSHPGQEATFRHMFDIIDTNHLTHELNSHDWEMLEYTCPDIPMADISDTAVKHFKASINKRWAKLKQRT